MQKKRMNVKEYGKIAVEMGKLGLFEIIKYGF